jgi:hypothetical protein
MKNPKVVLASVFVLFMLAACSKSGGSVSAPTSDTPSAVAPVAEVSLPDSCKLLSKEIVESVVGPVGDAKTDGSGPASSNCMYLAEDFSGISLMITKSSSDSFQKSFEASKSISGVDPVKVDGVGESAFFAGGTLNQLNVLKNDNWMIFSAFGATDPQATTKKLADKVLAAM